MKQTPNVLFVLTDDQRFDTINALDNPEIRTPNMDRLVSMGTTFTQAHIPSGTCGAICCPSRAMIHTSRTLFHLDGFGEEIPADHTTLGEVFRSAGYETFGTGKWHNGRASYHRSFTDGEHIFFGGMTDHWNVPCYHFDPSGRYEASFPRSVDAFTTNATQDIPGDHLEPGYHSSDLLADATASWIRDRGDDPWFAYLSFLAPHDPRTMPEKYRRMYPAGKIELPPNFMGGHPYDTGALNIRDEMLAGFPRTPDETRQHIADYYAMITHLDDCLGTVLKVLEEKHELENTVIIFTGDNGLAVGQHGLMGKQNHYEHSIRVPLIVSGPGIQKNARNDALIYLLDIFPTLCDHLGLKTPASVEGQSFAPILKGQATQSRDQLFFAYADTLRSIKKHNFKLTLAAVEDRQPVRRLFNVEADPWELQDLSEVPQYRKLRDELEAELRQTAVQWDDPESRWGEVFWDRWDR